MFTAPVPQKAGQEVDLCIDIWSKISTILDFPSQKAENLQVLQLIKTLLQRGTVLSVMGKTDQAGLIYIAQPEQKRSLIVNMGLALPGHPHKKTQPSLCWSGAHRVKGNTA